MCIKGFCVCKQCVRKNSYVCERRVYIKKLLYKLRVCVRKKKEKKKSLNMNRVCI